MPASGLHSSQDDSDIVADRGERLWGEYEIRADPERPDDRLAIDFYKKKSKGKHVTYTTGGFFELLRLWDQEESLISASTSGEDEGTETAVEGLVQGHAYAVISVVEVIQMIGTENLKMLRLRNPWGSFEWTGAWCDGDPRWLQNPRAVEACTARHTDAEEGIAGQVKDDGLFWYAAPHPPRRRPFCPVALAEQSRRCRMEYNDFMKHFTTIDMCHRSRGIADVRIDLHEDLGCTGPARGCAQVRKPPRFDQPLHLQTALVVSRVVASSTAPTRACARRTAAAATAAGRCAAPRCTRTAPTTRRSTRAWSCRECRAPHQCGGEPQG